MPGGGTQRLPRAVSKAKAMDMCLTARFMDAAEAERALVSRVLPADRLLDEALAAAATIAEFSLPAVMMVKESVNRAYETTLAEGVHFERRLFHSLFATEDQKEGMAAFVENGSQCSSTADRVAGVVGRRRCGIGRLHDCPASPVARQRTGLFQNIFTKGLRRRGGCLESRLFRANGNAARRGKQGGWCAEVWSAQLAWKLVRRNDAV